MGRPRRIRRRTGDPPGSRDRRLRHLPQRRARRGVATLDELFAACRVGRCAWRGSASTSRRTRSSSRWRSGFGLHELAVEDAIKAHQRPKLERYDETLFVVLRPARYVDESETVVFGEVRHLRRAELRDHRAARRRARSRARQASAGGAAGTARARARRDRLRHRRSRRRLLPAGRRRPRERHRRDRGRGLQRQRHRSRGASTS